MGEPRALDPERDSYKRLAAIHVRSLGSLLLHCGLLWRSRAIALVNAEAGLPLLRESHTRLLPYLQSPDGARISDLARELGVTKQAVQPLVAELAAIGVVRVERDRADARAKRVVLTEFGIRAMLHGAGVLLRVEDEIAPLLGDAAVDELKTLLGRLAASLASPSLGGPTG